MRLVKQILAIVMLTLFLLGLGVFLYPTVRGNFVDQKIQQTAKDFLLWTEDAPSEPGYTGSQVIIENQTEPTEPMPYSELWQDMTAYNENLTLGEQEDLIGKIAYEEAIFQLSQYGLENEIFGVITIPKLELEMPIFLGATSEHMAEGAALLGQTSIPIGGAGTNAVLAGHRGYHGAHYFRFIDQLVPGDTIQITNLWDTLTYQVTDILIIEPNEVEHILIQPEKDLVTLLTCHPYASGGRQRYLVICERF